MCQYCQKKKTRWSCLLTLLVLNTGVMANMTQLTPTQVYAKENSSAILTCARKDGQAIIETVWKNSQITSDANLYYLNGQCITTRFLKDSDLFSGLCNGNGTFSVVIKKIARTQHGAEWTCKSFLSQYDTSNKVVIHVLVPATSVTLSQPNGNYMKENQDEKITCTTSACRPNPRVQWYLRNSTTNIVQNLTQFSSNRYLDEENGLKAVESILNFNQNRSVHNLRLYCEVWTKSDTSDLKSNEITVNVTFPPESSPQIQGVEINKILRVIMLDTGTFVCSITGGNPMASISWNCFGSNDITSITQAGTVKSTIKWTALRNYKTCSCTSHHRLSKWKRTTNVSVDVLYFPSKPSFEIGEISVSDEIQLIENNSLRLSCKSESNPLPNYTWTGPDVTRKVNTLELTNVTRSNKGKYVCKVSNRMIRTSTSYEDGMNSSAFSLTILYPGIVIPMRNKSIVEGSQLEVECHVDYGNPKTSTIHWTRLKDESRWDDHILFIKNVSRADDSDYTCSAITKMYPTIGNSEIVEKNNSFHLNVFFATEIKTFSVPSISSGVTVVVNETQNVPFECILEANPFSNVTIKNPRGVIILEVSESNIANQTVLNATYKDAGEYVCAGRNNYTRGYAADSKLTLIVRSLPRPSSGKTSVTKVATVMHADATLHFTAWNYLDELNKTFFSWFKGNVIRLANDSKYLIHSRGLETNISVRNTTKEDLGLYKLNVRNSVGIYDHVYELRTADKPEPPRDFNLINNSITDSSVTLAWTPGFNGGFQQTFVLHFKMKHEVVWLKKTVIDNGDIVMNYTLSDLSSLQEYEIEMFAMNIQGNSANTGRLEFTTKAPLNEKVILQSKDDYRGIIGGSIAAVIIATVVITGAVFYFRKRELRTSLSNDHQPDTTAKHHALSTSEGHVSSEYTDLDQSRREINLYDAMNSPSVSTYEKIDTVKQVPSTYMELKDTMSSDDASNYVNMKI